VGNGLSKESAVRASDKFADGERNENLLRCRCISCEPQSGKLEFGNCVEIGNASFGVHGQFGNSFIQSCSYINVAKSQLHVSLYKIELRIARLS
jgi:hypothetical protein